MENMISQGLKPKPGQKAAIYIRVGSVQQLDSGTIAEPQPCRTAIYCRTASTHPNDFEAICIQRDKIRTFAFQRGYGNCEVYSDDGYSGNNLDRPAFAKMEADIEAGKIDTIIISNISRIARNMFLLETWRSEAWAKGVKLIAVDGSHEYPNFIKEICSAIRSKKRMAM